MAETFTECPKKIKEWERMLHLFLQRPTWNIYELRDIKPQFVSVPKIIYDLKNSHGYDIETIPNKNDPDKIYYFLRSMVPILRHETPRADLFKEASLSMGNVLG